MGLGIVGSYGMGYLVLKHCLTTELTVGEDAQHVNSKGLALLSMATLLSERLFPCDCLVLIKVLNCDRDCGYDTISGTLKTMMLWPQSQL